VPFRPVPKVRLSEYVQNLKIRYSPSKGIILKGIYSPSKGIILKGIYSASKGIILKDIYTVPQKI